MTECLHANIHQVTVREAEPFHALLVALSAEGRYLSSFGQDVVPIAEQRQRIAKLAANQAIFVAQYDGAFVAYLGVWGGRQTSNRHCGRMTVAVLQSHQRQGIAHNLLLSALGIWHIIAGIRRLEATCREDNHAALQWYLNHKFTIEGKRVASIFEDGRYINEIYLGLPLEGV